jgi:type I restriction enzyme S subunit
MNQKLSLPKGWEIKTLGDLYDITSSKRVFQDEWKSCGVPFYRAREIVKLAQNGFVDNELFILEEMYNEYSKKYGIPKAGDIMVTGVGTLGICYLVKSEDKFYFKDGNIIWLKTKGNVNSRYVEYAFKSDFLRKQIDDSVGATVGTYTIIKAKSTKIPVPPLPEQQRIVSILDETFAAIARAKANAEQNLKNANELFESYLQGVFENVNWETKKWGELCDFVRGPFGGSLKKNVFKESGYVVYEQKHAIHDHFNQLRYFIDEEKFNEMKRFEVFPGDIIMSCSGVTLGRVAVVPDGIPKGIINQALLKLTPKKNVSVHFIKHWLRSNIFQKIIFDYSGGAAIPNVPSAKILKDIKIPCPSLKEQERIVNEIETVLNETKRLEAIYQQKLLNLEELKKSVLQKAFAGELTTEKE